MRIGELARRSGVSVRALRYYEEQGLLRPERSRSGQLLFTEDAVERVLVANADQLVVVTALADPEPRTRMVDRCLVAAFEAGMDTLLCLTKSDLASSQDFLAQYAPLDVPHVVTSVLVPGSDGLVELRERLADFPASRA